MMHDLLELVGRDTDLRKVARTCGGEWAGPCPRCGGRDRFRVQPYAHPTPRWTCRQCCDRWRDAPGYLMWHDGLRYHEARAALGLPPAAPRHPSRVLIPPIDSEPPSHTWRTAAQRFVDMTARALWNNVGVDALAYLRQRGFTDATIQAAHLGCHVVGSHSRATTWGMDERLYPRGIWLPAGIVIPWFVAGQPWKIQIRSFDGRYYTVPGSANALYNADVLEFTQPAVIVEGAFDALAIQQVAGDLCAAVACGTTGARRMRWIGQLAQCDPVLIALDNEEHQNVAVTQAVAYWLDVLHPRAIRWRPYLKDCGAMLQQQMDLRAWVSLGLTRTRKVDQAIR